MKSYMFPQVPMMWMIFEFCLSKHAMGPLILVCSLVQEMEAVSAGSRIMQSALS